LPAGPEGAARRRILDAARDLFGRQGYAPTPIAQIERASGLTPGAGGLYRHFRSKKALLQQVIDDQLAGGPDLAALLRRSAELGDLRAQLRAVARAALRRLESERDLNRLLVRDLDTAPELLALVRDRELRAVHEALTRWLRAIAPGAALDAGSVATVLMGAVSHYWLMRDVFDGAHPFQPDEEAFLDALVEMAAAAVRSSD
jgi:AcrR family transcriptional regulator